jgi:hypothetical protein
LEELRKRLIGYFPELTSKELEKQLVSLSPVRKQGKFYFLAGRESDIFLREKRLYFSKLKWQEATTLTKILEKIPTITSVYVTGSLAMENVSSPADDIDILVVTRPHSLWFTRLLVICWTSLIGKYRLHGSSGEFGWCFNLWLDQNHLEMPKNSRSIYSAYEVVQAKQLLGTENELLKKNGWVNEYINYSTNVQKSKDYETRTNSGGKILGMLDLGAYFLQRLYMSPRLTRERVERGAAFFHPRQTDHIIEEKWQRTLKEIGVGEKDVALLAEFFKKGNAV